MKLGIIGLPQSGKSTILAALTGARGDPGQQASPRSGPKMATVTVHDERRDFLSALYTPKKTTYAKMEYMLPSEMAGTSPSEGGRWNQVRVCDGLLHVVRNFQTPGGTPPTPEQDLWQLEEEMILSDLLVAEKRIERIETDKKKGKKPEPEEYALVTSCRDILDSGRPLRSLPDIAAHPALKGFTFLCAKPMVVIVNNDDEDEEMPPWDKRPEGVPFVVVRGRLEQDIAGMTPEEAGEFQEAYHIEESALDRVIRTSYIALNRISFFTVISDEVRAWSIPAGTAAVHAAGAVHSDMEKGFIRAEVLSYDDLRTHGTFQEAKKAGAVRLEGKEYEVKDGDIINFRFNI